MVGVDHSSDEVHVVGSDGKLLKDRSTSAFELLGESLRGEGHEDEDQKAREHGDDLVLRAGAEKKARRDVETAQKDQADVVAEKKFVVDVAVYFENDRIEKQRGQQDQVERESSEEFADDDLRFGDGGGHERFDRAAAKLVADESRGEHGQHEEKDEDHPELKEVSQRCFGVVGEGAKTKRETSSEEVDRDDGVGDGGEEIRSQLSPRHCADCGHVSKISVNLTGLKPVPHFLVVTHSWLVSHTRAVTHYSC